MKIYYGASMDSRIRGNDGVVWFFGTGEAVKRSGVGCAEPFSGCLKTVHIVEKNITGKTK